MTTPRILSIAGSDSSGGAGIQADIKTITVLGGYAMTAITAITAQNTLGVTMVEALVPEMVAAQIDAVTDVVASQHGQPSRVMVVHPDDLSRTALTRITEAMSNPDRIVWVSRGRDALDRCSSIPSDGESLEPQVTGLVHIGGRSTQATLWTDEPSSRRVGETITIDYLRDGRAATAEVTLGSA